MMYYIVSADHVAPEYAATHVRVQVSSIQPPGEPRVYSATCHPYGTGKDRPTPEAAIRELFFNNGCTNIRIHRREA